MENGLSGLTATATSPVALGLSWLSVAVPALSRDRQQELSARERRLIGSTARSGTVLVKPANIDFKATFIH